MLNIENARPLLAQYLSAHLGSDDIVQVEPFERITIGHSRGMHRINVHYTKNGEDIRKSFALRAEQGGMFGGDTLIEVRLQRAVRNAGIPAAKFVGLNWMQTFLVNHFSLWIGLKAVVVSLIWKLWNAIS